MCLHTPEQTDCVYLLRKNNNMEKQITEGRTQAITMNAVTRCRVSKSVRQNVTRHRVPIL